MLKIQINPQTTKYYWIGLRIQTMCLYGYSEGFFSGLSEAAEDKQPPSRATRDPARQGAAHFAERKVPGTFTVIKMRKSGTRIQRPCCAGSPPPYAAPLLGRSLSGSQQSRERASSLPPLPLLGTASPWSNLAAIPPGLASFLLCGRSSRAFRIAAVRPRQKRRKAFRAARTQRSRAVGADKVRINRP